MTLCIALHDTVYAQEQLTIIYEKHQKWLLAGGPHGCPQQENLPDTDAHWVLYCLATATWEQLQQALSMTADDYNSYQRVYISELLELTEISKRCPELQHQLCAAAGVSVPAEVPAAYSSSGNATNSATIGRTTTNNSPASSSGEGSIASWTSAAATAWDLIVRKLKTTGGEALRRQGLTSAHVRAADV